MTTPLIEAIARAIYESVWVGEYPTSGIEHAMAIQNAKAALTAITEAGMVIVPREPTVNMCAAFWRQKNCGTQEVGEVVDCPDCCDMAAMRAAINAGAIPLDTKEGE